MRAPIDANLEHGLQSPGSRHSLPHDLHALTATQALEYIENDRMTVEQYVRALLTRVDVRNETAKAWVHMEEQRVLKQARDLDEVPRSRRGPLHGIPVGIKDIVHTKDMPTRFGSPLYEDNEPDVDASLVSILRSAGAIIMGKTTTSEFTILNRGPATTNSHDTERTPGGSSAGSAAVADLQVPLSVGTQTGGSVMRPASYTGVFAMKPTFNAVSLEGTKVISASLDTCGFFARSMEDLQLLADIFRVPNKTQMPPIALENARMALVRSPMWPMAGPGTVNAMERASKILQEHGVHVEDVELPSQLNDVDVLRQTHKVVLETEARTALLKDYLLDVDDTRLAPEIRALVEGPPLFSIDETREAHDRYASFRSIFDQFAAKYSAIITPSAQDVAPLGIHDMGDSCFNFIWTGLHTPVVHVPAFTGGQGLPVGLSVVGRRFHDQQLLQMCKLLSDPLMAEGGWHMTSQYEVEVINP